MPTWRQGARFRYAREVSFRRCQFCRRRRGDSRFLRIYIIRNTIVLYIFSKEFICARAIQVSRSQSYHVSALAASPKFEDFTRSSSKRRLDGRVACFSCFRKSSYRLLANIASLLKVRVIFAGLFQERREGCAHMFDLPTYICRKREYSYLLRYRWREECTEPPRRFILCARGFVS